MPRHRNTEDNNRADQKVDLKAKLRERIAVKKLGRTSKVIRDKRVEELEERLEQELSKNERNTINSELKLLTDIEDKEFSAVHTYDSTD